MREINKRVAVGNGSVTDIVTGMNARRRDRGSLQDGRKIGLWFEGQSDDRLTHIAAAAGTTRSALAQWLVDSVVLDADGVPVGWADAHPRPEELRIDAA